MPIALQMTGSLYLPSPNPPLTCFSYFLLQLLHFLFAIKAVQLVSAPCLLVQTNPGWATESRIGTSYSKLPQPAGTRQVLFNISLWCLPALHLIQAGQRFNSHNFRGEKKKKREKNPNHELHERQVTGEENVCHSFQWSCEKMQLQA